MREGDDENERKPRRRSPPRGKSGAKPKSQPRIRLRLDDESDDDVGYGKPPRAHQFKPGQSGNPKGRPKGKKNEATMLDELLFQRIKIREGGCERRITLFEGMLRRFAEDSLKGNIKAAAFLFSRYAAVSSADPQQSELSDDDQAVLRTYAQDLLAKSRKDNK
jgi:uncharacterized protein DUF5681